jgi:hypothetical protein
MLSLFADALSGDHTCDICGIVPKKAFPPADQKRIRVGTIGWVLVMILSFAFVGVMCFLGVHAGGDDAGRRLGEWVNTWLPTHR